MFKKLKHLTRSFSQNHKTIKDEKEIVPQQNKTLNRWIKYVENRMTDGYKRDTNTGEFQF